MRIKNTLVVALLFTLATIQPVFATTNYVLNIRSSADYARIPDSDSLDLVSTSFTLEAWINPSTFTSTDGAIISKRRVDGGSSYHLSISRFGAPSGQKSKVVLGMNNGGSAPQGLNYGLFTEAVIQSNAWYHVAGTYDRESNMARVYINGELKASERVVLALPLQNSSFPVTIGQMSLTGEPRPFIGLIDEARVWNRALSQAEVQTQMSLRLTGQEPGLVGYWNFDDNSIKDKSVYRNDSTLVGAAQLVGDPLLLLPVRPQLKGMKLSVLRGFQYAIVGESGQTYTLEGSEDLQQWTSLTDVKSTNVVSVFLEPTATNQVYRFYRARLR